MKWIKKVLLSLTIGPLLMFSANAFAENIMVFAAASMTNALQKIGAEYEKAYPEDKLIFSFAGSSSLAKQIEQGAPADLFISADQKWMDYVAEKLPKETQHIQPLVENELVLISAKESGIQAESIQAVDFAQILANSYLAVADDHVPAGRYAKTALENLNLWGQVEHRLAKAKDVRAVLAFVERGELPLGIVYATDAKSSDKVKIVAAFPQESYGKIVYPAATTSEKPEAKRFLDYLSSETAKQAFEQAGFKRLK